ncbi:MAG: hypothetical protein Q4D87_07020 [Actinomycetaceae bacterium]|nr:hypothetical protein [Actinomycetaceae bacterium]
MTSSLLYPTYERWNIANLILSAAVLAVAVGYPVALTISQLIRATRALRGDRLPNLFLDEHYLCTVAAGGHASLVKPLRMGLRHGRPVVVNRQLLVANAFEQVLEEHVPRTHRTVRHIYDKYGFPVARLIRTKFVADLVWILMKPAEWIFLAVIYATDTHPEDRIAVQYTK